MTVRQAGGNRMLAAIHNDAVLRQSQNPRYEGATPEDVARALLRPLGAPRPGGQAVVGDEVTVEQPLPDQPRNDGSHLS